MSGLKTKPPANRRTPQSSIEEVEKPKDFLGGPVSNLRFDMDKRLTREVKGLAACVEHLEPKNGEIKVRAVSLRMLLTEAVIDLLDKYQDGNGKYRFEAGEEHWHWK